MKKMLVLCLCAVLILLTFSACGSVPEDETDFEKGFFIGTVESAKRNSVVFKVDEDFVEKYGETVNFKKDGVGKLVEVGDEVRVDMKSKKKVEDFTVLLQKKHSFAEAADQCIAFTVFKWSEVKVPSELIELKIEEGKTAEANFFGEKYAYRVVQQDSQKTYLSAESADSAKYVVFGDLTEKCRLGDFVILQVSKCQWYPKNGSIYSAKAEDVDKIEVVDSLKVYNSAKSRNTIKLDKPVIYLYPEKIETVNVKLELDGNLTCTYPEYTDGWDGLTVSPDGIIKKDGREYYCLYWEGESRFEPDFSKGFCVKSEDTARFLEKTLREIGLNDREANEFIIYWLPILQKNEYNLISFQGQNYVDAAKLTVSPTPDSVLRVFMSFKPLENKVSIKPQTFQPFIRNGFTVVEWGGGQAE